MNIKALFFAILFIFVVQPSAAEDEVKTYQSVTMPSLSKLYWTVDMLDLNNEAHLDNYLKINECELYTEFFHNEFEWKMLRDSAKKSLENGKNEFSRRYQYMQQIYLDDYDFEAGKFSIFDRYHIDRIYRFEIVAQAFGNNDCTAGQDIEDYPSAVIVELNRPFSLSEVPVTEDVASVYVAEKARALEGIARHERANMERHESRDAYLVMQFKIVGFERVNSRSGSSHAVVQAELEGYEIYGDKKKNLLLYKHEMPPPKRIYKGAEHVIED